MVYTGNMIAGSILLPVVAAALVDGQGRVLLQCRPVGGAMAGLWEFPGGKIEPGETPEAALIRELHEELAITVAPDALTATAFASASLGARHLVLLLFVVRAWTDDPLPLAASALRWVLPRDMHALPMPPADTPLIDMLDVLIATG